jgi:hypothetical protein
MTRLSPHELRVVAARAGVDPRTVLRVISGAERWSTTRARVLAALEELRAEGARAAPMTDARFAAGPPELGGAKIGEGPR